MFGFQLSKGVGDGGGTATLEAENEDVGRGKRVGLHPSWVSLPATSENGLLIGEQSRGAHVQWWGFGGAW